MEFLHVPVKLGSVKDVLSIKPFGCVHSDDPGFRHDVFMEDLEEIKKTKYCVAVGMGDYRNFLRTRARNHLRQYVADRNSFIDLDKMVRKEAMEFAKRYLEPIAGKLIGLAEGNHYHEFADGTTDTQVMCRYLNVPYLDKPAFIRLGLEFENRGGTTKVLKMLVAHGDWGQGAASHGADVASAERKIRAGFNRFDIVLLGHTHRKWVMPMPELDIPERGELRCIERPRVIVRTGCYVAAYDKCTKNYAQEKLLPPTELGAPRIDVLFYRKGDGGVYHKFKGYV